MTSIKNNESMTARANNSHRQLVLATISTEVACKRELLYSTTVQLQLQAVVAGGGNAVVEVLVVAVQVIP
jgi:hypothetical protein